MTASLLDHLQEQGYDPHTVNAWYDLTVSGIGTVRVSTDKYDTDYVRVYGFDAHMACEWIADMSRGTPDAVVIATIEAAERLLADRRGGPVTPAQAARA